MVIDCITAAGLSTSGGPGSHRLPAGHQPPPV